VGAERGFDVFEWRCFAGSADESVGHMIQSSKHREAGLPVQTNWRDTLVPLATEHEQSLKVRPTEQNTHGGFR